jgi:hypothetical protein
VLALQVCWVNRLTDRYACCAHCLRASSLIQKKRKLHNIPRFLSSTQAKVIELPGWAAGRNTQINVEKVKMIPFFIFLFIFCYLLFVGYDLHLCI